MTDRASPFAALARAHLRTRAERAVFGVVAASSGRWWTAPAAARAAGVDEIDADQALRRFAAAGIVEQELGRTDGSRYRYRAEMAYLSTGGDTEEDGELRDPVCGMPVAPDTPHVADDHGHVVRFCSLPCLVLWQRAHRARRQ